jgi:hypothetical protein
MVVLAYHRSSYTHCSLLCCVVLCLAGAHGTTPYHPTTLTHTHSAHHELLHGSAHPRFGRNSPEYKDNEPGSIYAPAGSDRVTVPNTGTPYNKGYQLRAHLGDTEATRGSDESGTEEGSPYPPAAGVDTPYVPTVSIFAPSGETTPTTPYRAAQYNGATSHGGDQSTAGMSASYSHSAARSTSGYADTTAMKQKLQFEPDGEEATGLSCNSVDTSFDCEMVFTSIYSGSPHPNRSLAHPAVCSSLAGAHAVDEEVFEGENKHFKSSLLDVKSQRLSPDALWAGQKRPAFVYDRDVESPDGTGALTTVGGAGLGISNSSGGSSYWGGLQAKMGAAFELTAEDALKLGEVRHVSHLCAGVCAHCLAFVSVYALVAKHRHIFRSCTLLYVDLTAYKLSTWYLQMLYILRPLIYAALVHQIEVYRSMQQSSDANSGTAGSSASGAARGNSSTSSSGSTGGTSAEGSSVFAKVLDTLTVDALLGAVALAVSFVSARSLSLFLRVVVLAAAALCVSFLSLQPSS